MKPKKERNQNMKEWPNADKQFSEYAVLKALMRTPEIDVNAEAEVDMKSIEYALCPNFRR